MILKELRRRLKEIPNSMDELEVEFLLDDDNPLIEKGFSVTDAAVLISKNRKALLLTQHD